jgi:Ni2+-binding GTPase involved in maturation of urease and hydrogenase
MGPTGSGKSSLIKPVCEHLKLPITKNKVLIDDLVVDNPYYRKKVKEFLDTKITR